MAKSSTKTSTKTTKKADGVLLELEDSASGEVKKVTVKIAAGFPSCRPLPGQNVVVKSDDLMNLAMGTKLDESTQKSFDQLGFGKDKAIAYLERLALIGSSMVEIKE